MVLIAVPPVEVSTLLSQHQRSRACEGTGLGFRGVPPQACGPTGVRVGVFLGINENGVVGRIAFFLQSDFSTRLFIAGNVLHSRLIHNVLPKFILWDLGM